MNIIRYLSVKHEITLYAAQGSHMNNVKIIDLGLPPFETDSSIENNDWATKAVTTMKQIYIGEILKDADNYDIIHIQTEPVYLGMPYASLVKTPILFTSHNSFHSFETRIFSYFDRKINLSGLSNCQVKNIPLTQKVPVIYNGVEAEDFPFVEKDSNYFLFLGRLVKDKGIDIFLQLAQNDPKHIYYIVGKGNKIYEKISSDAAQKYRNIKFLGMLPYRSPEWYKTLSHAKALIMPITYEDSCPLVPLEAMACGTPVIAFNRGALPEQLVDGKTGYIVKSNQTYELLEKIGKISNLNKAKYLALRRNSRTHIMQKFHAKIMAQKYESLYKEIIVNNQKQ